MLIVFEATKKHNIRLYHYANMANHLHLPSNLVGLPGECQRLKELSIICAKQMTSRIAVQITGAKKGKPLNVPFFESIYFYTRLGGIVHHIVWWGSDYKRVVNYIAGNIRSFFFNCDLSRLTEMARLYKTEISDFRFAMLDLLPKVQPP